MIEGILILDFGSQYTQLIARRVRELQVYCEIIPYNKPLEEITHFKVKGFVLSGGPLSVFDKEAPRVDVLALLKKAPVLGICYGMQLLAHALGGEVKPAKHREYGWSEVHWEEPLLEGLERQAVWMSHGDLVEKVPEGAQILAYSQGSGSEASCVAAFRGQGFLGVQFHPEVSHTQKGKEILKAFIDFCGVQTQWSPPQIIPHLIEEIQNQVGGEKVLCALSGGVDSTVAATLLTQALGYNQVRCVFVDNGLLRKNEFQDVLKMYQDLHLNIEGVDASSEFLSRLKGVMDPEKKRKII
ncbi:MAG: glutamine-hydrolyzing GMP synthase, partial [Bdellovibrio sp.]